MITKTIGGVSQLEMPRRKTDSTSKTKDTHEDVLAKVLKMKTDWWDYVQPMHSKWLRYHKLYNNERVQKFYHGVTDTFVPMSFSTIETMVAAISTGDLSVEFTPQDIYKYLSDKLTDGMTFVADLEREQYLVDAISQTLEGGVIDDDSLNVINALFQYYWDAGDWDVKLENLVRSGLKSGNGSWWLSWDVDRPKLVNVPFKDFIFDPTAVDDDSCGYMGRRYLSTKDKLAKVKLLDPETRELVPRYKNLELVPELSTIGDETMDKSEKEQMLMGSTLGTKDGQIEIIEIVTEDRMYTVANRTTVIEDAENIFKAQARLAGIEMDGIIPGISWANYKDESLYVGKSEIATFDREQERLNDLANQKSDSITRSLIQNTRIDPKYKALAKMLNVPGAVIPVPEGAVERLPQAQVQYQVFNEESSIKNNIREVTATDQIVKGVGSASDVTATEAKLQVAQAGQRIEMKIKSLERGPLKRLARLTYQMIRLFITDPMLIPTVTNRGIQPVMYNPNNYSMDFMPRVQLTIYAKDKQRAEQSDAVATYQMLIQDPTNNLEAVKKVLLPKIVDIDKSELKEIMTPPEGAMLPGADPMAAQGAPLPTGAPA